MKSFLELAGRRRSVRSFAPDPIGGGELMSILEAARLAPSGNNSQPWRFVVVRDGKTKRRLAEASGGQLWIADAPVVVAVVGDIAAKMKGPFPVGEAPDASDPQNAKVLLKTVRDAAIAAEHIVLAAADIGMGSCWVAKFEQEDVAPIIGVPKSCYVVGLIALGRPAESPPPRPRHPLREIVFEERYGRRREADTACPSDG